MPHRFLALLAISCFAGSLVAHPADEVLLHVPPGTAVCIVVRDLSGRMKQLADSPFASWFFRSAIGKKLLDAIDLNNAGEFELTLKHQFGLSTEDLVHDVFGDAVVFAYTPGTPERALIILKPRKPDVAAKFLAKLDDLQKQAGELESVNAESHRGITYTSRKKKEGVSEAYLLRDGILAFASDEASLKSYLDFRVERSAPAGVATSLAKLNVGDSFATVWFDPRSFDAAFAEKRKLAEGSDRATIETIASIWSAVDHFAIHADLTDKLHVRASAMLNESKLPGIMAGLLPFAPGQSPLWNAIPTDALVAVAGRFAVALLLSKADELSKVAGQPPLTKGMKNDLGPLVGKDKLAAVIEALGPDWGLWLNAPETTDAWTPDWTFALRVRSDPTGKIDTAKSLLEGVDAAAQLARLAYNSSHADQLELNDDTVAGIRVRSFAGQKLPTGMRPSFAVKVGYFVFASSAERIAKFEAPTTTAGTAKESPLIRISSTGLRSTCRIAPRPS